MKTRSPRLDPLIYVCAVLCGVNERSTANGQHVIMLVANLYGMNVR